jgi:multicomponent Na+:H+ antiporter subunit D
MPKEGRVLAIALNPGFVCILAALIVLALPRAARPFTIVGAGALALWLMLDREFGEAAAAAQMGVPVVLLDLDALNRIFGIAMLLALIIIGACSGARRNRAEDAAILLLAGGAVSALFVGDLVSFAAAASLSGLAAAWLVFASPAPGGARTGVRLLIWFGLEGLLILVGVAFQLSAGAASSMFAQLDVTRIGGAFIFAALMIRVGAPFAHVWLKDGAEHASPVGAAAFCAFTSMLGVYALARLFAAEPLLAPIGAAMAVLGVIFAMIEDDLRRAAASGLSAQIGVCIMLIGVGSPLALAAAEGHAFTNILAFVAVMLALGGVFGRLGSARISQIEGGARAMPISAALLAIAGLAAAGAPGFAVFVTATIGLEALAQWRLEGPWLVASAVPAGLMLALMLRPTLALYRAPPGAKPRNEAPFPMLLGLTLAVFFCLSIGLAPGWLYGLLPAQLTFQPYAIERVAATLELLGAAGDRLSRAACAQADAARAPAPGAGCGCVLSWAGRGRGQMARRRAVAALWRLAGSLGPFLDLGDGGAGAGGARL